MKKLAIIFSILPLVVFSQWTKVDKLFGFGHKIIMTDTLHGYAATSEGLYETTDGWKTSKMITNSFHVRSFDLSSSGSIACSGVDLGALQMGYRVSHDGGKTWLANNFPTMEGHSNILFKGEDTLYAHGSRTKTMVSYDGGRNWSVLKIHPDLTTWGEMVLINNNELLLSASIYKDMNWHLYRGSLHDTVWQEIISIEDGPRKFHVLPEKILASGGYGNLYSSSKEFNQLKKETTGFNHLIGNMQYLDENTGFICGGNFTMRPIYAVVIRTNDGGKTWERTALPEAERGISDIFFFNKEFGYAIDYESNIFKTINAGGPAIPDTINLNPKDTGNQNPQGNNTFVQETVAGNQVFQITLYPNPGKDQLTISWEYALEASNTIYLTDIHGRILLEKTVESTQSKIQIEVPKIASGMYFVSVPTPNGYEVLKWVKE